MKKEKLINNVVKSVNWDLVLYNMKQLTPGRKITKLQLVEELTEILNNLIITEKRQIITDIWTINYEKEEGGDFILEVMFTPIVVWIDTLTNSKKRDKISRLEQRLKLALEIEDYENAAKIRKSLTKLVPKGK